MKLSRLHTQDTILESSDIRKLKKKAKKQGWKIETSKRKGHIKWIPPGKKKIVVSPGTPSDHRSMKNLRADLKRSGFVE